MTISVHTTSVECYIGALNHVLLRDTVGQGSTNFWGRTNLLRIGQVNFTLKIASKSCTRSRWDLRPGSTRESRRSRYASIDHNLYIVSLFSRKPSNIRRNKTELFCFTLQPCRERTFDWCLRPLISSQNYDK